MELQTLGQGFESLLLRKYLPYFIPPFMSNTWFKPKQINITRENDEEEYFGSVYENYMLNRVVNTYNISKKWFIGGSALKTNQKYMPMILFSKNNVELLNMALVKRKLLGLYATVKWLNCARIRDCRRMQFLFASITPVFANYVQWGARTTGGVASSYRWVSGMITASTNIERGLEPDCVVIPDVSENPMIIKEAYLNRIPILSIVGSDCRFELGGLTVMGNSHDYRTLVQFALFITTLNCPRDFKFHQEERYLKTLRERDKEVRLEQYERHGNFRRLKQLHTLDYTWSKKEHFLHPKPTALQHLDAWNNWFIAACQF